MEILIFCREVAWYWKSIVVVWPAQPVFVNMFRGEYPIISYRSDFETLSNRVNIWNFGQRLRGVFVVWIARPLFVNTLSCLPWWEGLIIRISSYADVPCNKILEDKLENYTDLVEDLFQKIQRYGWRQWQCAFFLLCIGSLFVNTLRDLRLIHWTNWSPAIKNKFTHPSPIPQKTLQRK